MVMRHELVTPISVKTPVVEYGAGINVEKGLYLHVRPNVDAVNAAFEAAKTATAAVGRAIETVKTVSDNIDVQAVKDTAADTVSRLKDKLSADGREL